MQISCTIPHDEQLIFDSTLFFLDSHSEIQSYMYDFIVAQPACVHVLSYPIRNLNTDILGMGLNFSKNHMRLINQAELATTYTGCVML